MDGNQRSCPPRADCSTARVPLTYSLLCKQVRAVLRLLLFHECRHLLPCYRVQPHDARSRGPRGKCLLLSNMVPFVIEYDRIHVYCVCILHVFLPVSGNILAYPSDTPDTRIRCVSDVYPMYPPVSTVATKIREDMPPDTHRRCPLGWAKTRLCIHFCILR
jgi:hypothetical protein